jgi:hypothetical protein
MLETVRILANIGVASQGVFSLVMPDPLMIAWDEDTSLGIRKDTILDWPGGILIFRLLNTS